MTDLEAVLRLRLNGELEPLALAPDVAGSATSPVADHWEGSPLLMGVQVLPPSVLFEREPFELGVGKLTEKDPYKTAGFTGSTTTATG